MSRPSPKIAPIVEIAPPPERDPLSPLHHEVLALFRGPLAEVRFPDLDRSALDSLAHAVVQAQLEVESLDRELDGARQRVRDAVAMLGAATARALAYARIYAEGQPELSAIVADVRDGAPLRPRDDGGPKKRGRPRKDAATVELLPTDAPTDVAAK